MKNSKAMAVQVTSSNLHAILIHLVVVTTVVLLSISVNAQKIIYQDSFRGGVTGDVYRSHFSGTYYFDVHIAPCSQIRKAYIVAGRYGPYRRSLRFDLNGTEFAFNSSNQAVPGFHSHYGGGTSVHAIDVTSAIEPNKNTIPFTIIDNLIDDYFDYYLMIAYDNACMSTVNVGLLLNDKDCNQTITWDPVTLAKSTTTGTDIGFSLIGGYMCNMQNDHEEIFFNGVSIGKVGGRADGTPGCRGVQGDFYYENDKLYGLNGDKADISVYRDDGLSNLSILVPSSTSTFNMRFEHSTGAPVPVQDDNTVWGGIFVYGDADGGSVTVDAGPDVANCSGDSIQLQATSNTDVRWFPSTGLSCTNCPNPKVAPGVTETYYAVVGQGCCSDTDAVVISSGNINLQTNKQDAECGGTGSASVIITQGTPNYIYQWDDPQNQTTPTATNLAPGTYHVTVTDAAGCSKTEQIIINGSGNMDLDIAQITNQGCNRDGAVAVVIKATPTNGTSPYNYQWDDPNNSTVDTVLVGVGTYTVEVTDATGCTSSESITIEPILVKDSIVINDPTCGGCDDGQVSVHVRGGVKPYRYRWDDTQGNTISDKQTTSNLPSGTYTVTVTDQKGCSIEFEITVGLVSINEVITGKFNVFPNPNNGSFSIEADITSANAQITIYSVTGKKIYNQQTSLTTGKIIDIDLDNTARGIYYIRIVNEDKVYSGRLSVY